jgi:hypothetical protein
LNKLACTKSGLHGNACHACAKAKHKCEGAVWAAAAAAANVGPSGAPQAPTGFMMGINKIVKALNRIRGEVAFGLAEITEMLDKDWKEKEVVELSGKSDDEEGTDWEQEMVGLAKERNTYYEFLKVFQGDKEGSVDLGALCIDAMH